MKWWYLLQGCQPPTSWNIENMIGSQVDDRWRHNARHIDVILVDCNVSFQKKKLTQNIWDFIVGKSSLQEIGNFSDYPEIPDINLETGRYGSKSGVSRIIQKSWQPCYWQFFLGGEGVYIHFGSH